MEFLTAVYHLVHDNMAFFDRGAEDKDEDDVAKENLDWIEDAATGSPLGGARKANSCKVKKIACRLAAAYYMSTYSPEMHNERCKIVLYSFPWVVAADVIAFSVSEGSS